MHVPGSSKHPRRPRLLFLSQTLPFPPDGGVYIRTFNVYRLLAQSFDVTALCFHRPRGTGRRSGIDESLAVLREFGEVETFPIPQDGRPSRFAWDHVRSVATNTVYTRYLYNSAPYRERLEELLRTRSFDLVHVDTLDLATYLPLLQSLPVVCVHHNVESALLRRRALAETLRWRRAYLRHQAALMEAEERRWCGRVALNVAVSDPDRERLGLQAPAGRYITVPNGVDTDKFRPAEGKDEGIVFVGGTTWFPNKDALAFFSEEILPLLNDSRTAVPICWVGRATEQEQQSFQERHGIRMTGYVDDIRPYVHDAACYVVPLRVGGGTRLKILDAWAMGKAVVSTSVGCEGLAAEHGGNILIADDPRAFADAVRGVLQNPDLRARLGRAARTTVETKYSWDIIGESMTDEYLSVARSAASPAGEGAGAPPVTVGEK